MPNLDCVIAGMNFRPKPAKELYAQTEPGFVCLCQREPTNPYDSNAIGIFVMHDGGEPVSCTRLPDETIDQCVERHAEDGIFPELVGYVPKVINPVIADAMDNEGAPCVAVVITGNLVKVVWTTGDVLAATVGEQDEDEDEDEDDCGEPLEAGVPYDKE